jgi:hypothetical protein
MGFMSALALIFIALKLTNVITWSWWVVLLPIYVNIVIFLSLIILFAIVGGVANRSSNFKRPF